jgi:hypothetical protein
MWKDEPATTVIRHKFCDDCGIEVRVGLACSKMVCEYCKKDLCEKCIGYEEETDGDYRVVWCKKCWSAGEEYHLKIQIHKEEIEKLYKEWREKCSDIGGLPKKNTSEALQ